MNVSPADDHGGFALKEHLKVYLKFRSAVQGICAAER